MALSNATPRTNSPFLTKTSYLLHFDSLFFHSLSCSRRYHRRDFRYSPPFVAPLRAQTVSSPPPGPWLCAALRAAIGRASGRDVSIRPPGFARCSARPIGRASGRDVSIRPLALRGAPRGHWPRVRTRCFHTAPGCFARCTARPLAARQEGGRTIRGHAQMRPHRHSTMPTTAHSPQSTVHTIYAKEHIPRRYNTPSCPWSTIFQ